MLRRVTRFNFLCRALCLWVSLSTVRLGWSSPGSLTWQVIAAGRELGTLTLLVMSLCVVAGLIDVLVSDLMPARFTVHWLSRRRHLGYMLLAATYLVQAIPSMTLNHPGAGALTTHYVGMGAICAWLAWALVIRSYEQGRPYAS